MNLKKSSYKNLENRVERATAKIARIAWRDVNFGGANAIVMINRLIKLNSPNIGQYESAVNAAYASQDGVAVAFTAFECPECGSVYLGEEKALACCVREEIWAEIDEHPEEDTYEDREIEELSRVTCEEFYQNDDVMDRFFNKNTF